VLNNRIKSVVSMLN